MGVHRPGVACTEATVPGYRVVCEVNGKEYEVREVDGSDGSGIVVEL